jgi:hypothetical protein
MRDTADRLIEGRANSHEFAKIQHWRAFQAKNASNAAPNGVLHSRLKHFGVACHTVFPSDLLNYCLTRVGAIFRAAAPDEFTCYF